MFPGKKKIRRLRGLTALLAVLLAWSVCVPGFRAAATESGLESLEQIPIPAAEEPAPQDGQSGDLSLSDTEEAPEEGAPLTGEEIQEELQTDLEEPPKEEIPEEEPPKEEPPKEEIPEEGPPKEEPPKEEPPKEEIPKEEPPEEEISEEEPPEEEIPEDMPEAALLTQQESLEEYADIAPEEAFLLVTKTFSGVEEIPQSFFISVDGTRFSSDSASVTHPGENQIQLTWKIPVSAANTYRVQEGGAEVEGKLLSASPEGILSGVDLAVPAATVSTGGWGPYPSCSEQDFSLARGQVLVIAAKKNVIVVSVGALPESARRAIYQAVKTNASHDFKPDEGGAGASIYYYNVRSYLGQTITIDGTNVTVSESGDQIHIGATKEWTKCAVAAYDYQAAQSDIQIRNAYSPATAQVTVEKTVSGNLGNPEQYFPFTATVTEGRIVAVEQEPLAEGVDSWDFSLKSGDSITFTVTIGAQFSVEETDSGVYAVTIDGEAVAEGSKAVKALTVSASGGQIHFHNRYDVVLDTGVQTDSAVYLLLLTGSVFGGALLHRRRKS